MESIIEMTCITRCLCSLEKRMSSYPITVLKQSNACTALRSGSKTTQGIVLTKFHDWNHREGICSKVKVDKLPIKKESSGTYLITGFATLQKPGSIRVVFDCSACYQGESFNGHLLQGPDLTSKLTGVLRRFREKVAFITDIEKMFFLNQGSKGRSELPSLLIVAKWRYNSRTSRALHHSAPLWSWFISRVF